MNFRTQINLQQSDKSVTYQHSLMMIGSCFAENIGRKLQNCRFRADVNPFGVIYNPLSVEKSLRILLNKQVFTKEDLFLHNGLWNSFAHHSSFSDLSVPATLKHINTRIEKSAMTLQNADYLIITFGTAWIYELKTSNEVVSNCHKLPDNNFNRRRLSIAEILEKLIPLLNDITSINPKINFIFTVSPIRHWKDGAHENQLSKSILLLAIDELQQQFSQVNYFPAYEIMMDELRDYRFYDEDMIHVNNVAVNYIWEKFSEVYFNKETQKLQHEVLQLLKLENHKPFNPESDEHLRFLQKLELKKNDFRNRYPYINI